MRKTCHFDYVIFQLCSWVVCFLICCNHSWSSDLHIQTQTTGIVEIDRVDFSGVTAMPRAEIDSALEIAPGEPLDRSKVVRTEENLQILYVQHGYEEVKIKSRLVRRKNLGNTFETVLEFMINEGSPLRIASLNFLLQDATHDEQIKKAWKIQEEKFKSKLPFSVGDTYSQEKMNELKQAIQDVLARSEYIGVRIDETRRLAQPPPAISSGSVPSHWLEIDLAIDLGDQVSFGFRGNTVFTQGYLDGLIAEQRLLGLGKDYIASIRLKLEEEYRSAGYAGVKVTPYTFEVPGQSRRRVTYFIREGPKVELHSVQFDGSSAFSVEQLGKVFFERASPLLQNRVYVEKDIQKAAELLIEWMKEQGYLSSRVVATNVKYPTKPRTQIQNSSVNVLIYLYEGDQTVVDSVAVRGATAYSSSDILDYLHLKKGAPLNLFALGEGIENLKKAYRSKGYLALKILNDEEDSLVQYSNENRIARINLEVEEGPQFRLSRIELEGVVNAHERVILREVHMKVNEILTDADMIQTERQLRKLGIFSSVEVKLIDDVTRPGYKIARILLKEADRGILSYGPGFRNDLGIRFFGQLAYTDLWGENHTVSVSANANRRFSNYNFGEGQAQVTYAWPWFGIAELNFRPTVAYAKTQYINFYAETYTLAANWDRQLFVGLPIITAYLSYSWEYINQFAASSSQDIGQYQIATITPKLSIDLRDSPLAPTSGFFSLLWADVALPLFGSQAGGGSSQANPISYYRVQTRNDYYIPIFQRVVLYFSFRVGYEQTVGPESLIPVIKEFALGGITSIRGYAEQSIYNPTPLTNGSLSYVNYRSQIDLPFSGPLKFGLFADAGNLLVNNFSLGGLNYGAGFGFHYQTPVGPVNFDWGFNLAPRPADDPYVIHFSVGII